MRRRAALVIALPLIAGSVAARAQEDMVATSPPSSVPALESLPTKVAEVPGTWDLSRDGTNRRCVMTLLKDRGPAGQLVNFPAGCRRALPVMTTVAGWLYADEAVRLVDKDVRPILRFKRRPDRRSYVGTAEGGETYSFVPLDTAGMRPPEPEPAQAALATQPPPNALLPNAPVPAELAPSPTAVAPPTTPDGPQPGTYAIDRLRTQGACRVVLAPTGAVKLLPGCQDDGIEVFNPVAWDYARGRITLTAKRGHTLGLVANGDGRWRRDPETGAILLLRRVGP